MQEIKKILKNRRIELGLTMLEVAHKVGVSEGTISRWESGDIANMKRDKIMSLANALAISPAVIMGWEEPSELPTFDNILPISTQKLPLLGDIACGQPIFTNEERESYVEVGTNVKADFCLRAKGDSMVNARILDGDIVFIKKQPSVENGEIAAVVIDDEATLKRVYYSSEENVLTLTAENPAYSPKVFHNETLNHIHILGKAVAFQSDVK